MPELLILNGPNLNLLGTRQPEVYGHQTLADVEALCAETANAHGFSIVCKQSNSEGGLVDILHSARGNQVGVAFNAGAYTHTSVALRDAISAIELPVVEIHMSNVHAREEFRHNSYMAPVCLGQISGFGADSYRLAVEALINNIKASST